MEIESVFFDSKWQILTELSHASLSPTELSKRTGTSLANISMQLRLLEALDFIEKERISNSQKGQPRKIYSLKKDFAYLILGTKSAIGKKMFRLDFETMPFFTAWLINDAIAPYLIIRIFFEFEEQLKDALSFGFLGRHDDEIEILIIHELPQNLSSFHEKQVQRGDRKYRINAHIHTSRAFNNGIAAGDPYFVGVLKKVFIINEKGGFLSIHKKGKK